MSRRLADSRARRWTPLAASFVFVCALVIVPSVRPQDFDQGNARASLRKDPKYAQLHHDGRAFLALPAAQQDAMRKLHQDLDQLAPAERDWLMEVLQRYATWLDKLPQANRQAVLDAPDEQARLQMVKDLREKEWIARQPKALQLLLEKLPKSKPAPALAAASTVGLSLGNPWSVRPISAVFTAAVATTDLRAESITLLKIEESQKNRIWYVAANHWNELTDANFKSRPYMPTHAGDFDKGKEKLRIVETYINEYLWPALSPQEQARLKSVEGKWPLYPMTLVELADKHPLALPQQYGPTDYMELPTQVQTWLEKAFPPKQGKFKDYDDFIRTKAIMGPAKKRLANLSLPTRPTPALEFACAVATLHGKKGAGAKLPFELWAARPGSMSIPMQVFLDQKGTFWGGLSPEERAYLIKYEGSWPEYPLKVQELAKKYGMEPPWQTLPDFVGKSAFWDNYRINPNQKNERLQSLNQVQQRDEPSVEQARKELQKLAPGQFDVPEPSPKDPGK